MMFKDVPLGIKIDAHPAKTPEHVNLDGQYASLVPISTSHASALFEQLCLKSPDTTWAYMSTGPFADSDKFLKHVENLSVSKDPLFFTVITRVDLPSISAGTPVGFLSLMRIDTKNRGIEVGNITFSAVLQRTTVATDAVYLAMKHCIEDLGNRRLEWKCDSLNAKSRKAAERFGFVFEGIFRQHFIVRGRNRDTAWYSIVDNEWPAKKVSFEEWLNPGNFDENGKQKKGLVELRIEVGDQEAL